MLSVLSFLMSSDEKVYYGVLDTETTTATDHLNCEPEDHPALTSPLLSLSYHQSDLSPGQQTH